MVHQYKLNGYNIVLDMCSGSVHVVDEVAYDIIAMFKEKSTDEIVKYILDTYKDEEITEKDVLECIEDVKSLEDAGKLYTADTYEGMAFDFKNRKNIRGFYKKTKTAKTLVQKRTDIISD